MLLPVEALLSHLEPSAGSPQTRHHPCSGVSRLCRVSLGWWRTEEESISGLYESLSLSLDVTCLPVVLCCGCVRAPSQTGRCRVPLDAHGAHGLPLGGSLTAHALPLRPALPSPSAHSRRRMTSGHQSGAENGFALVSAWLT